MRKLLLISTSKTYGTRFLEHAGQAIREHLHGISRVTFIPYALANHDAYARLAASAFGDWGIELQSLHQSTDPIETIQGSQAIFAGGGNTFRLLRALYDRQLLEPIRHRVSQGMPYMGSSAGSNIACPTIGTTNDMPIVQPPSFAALNLIPFQINPHFADPDPNSTHQGETRETRLREYLEENNAAVIGIREGCWLKIDGQRGEVQGTHGGVLFQRDCPRRELSSGESLDFLLN